MSGRASDAGPLHEQLDELRRQSHRGLKMMKVQFRLPGGDLEYAVLSKLWELGSASARDIHTQVGELQGLVYTTTAKVLDRLHAKRLVSRERKGMAFIYRPRVARAVVDGARARAFLTRLLGPAPRSAVSTLVDAMESLDPKLLDELAELIATRRRSPHGT
jgi:predicted transcriptional regulator